MTSFAVNRGYREADLRLCFRICKKPVFSRRGSFDVSFDASFTVWTRVGIELVQLNDNATHRLMYWFKFSTESGCESNQRPKIVMTSHAILCAAAAPMHGEWYFEIRDGLVEYSQRVNRQM